MFALRVFPFPVAPLGHWDPSQEEQQPPSAAQCASQLPGRSGDQEGRRRLGPQRLCLVLGHAANHCQNQG